MALIINILMLHFLIFPNVEQEIIKSFIDESFAPAFLESQYEVSFQKFYSQNDGTNGIITFINIISNDNIIVNKENIGWHMKQHVKRRNKDINKKHLSPISPQNDQNEKISFLKGIEATPEAKNNNQEEWGSFY